MKTTAASAVVPEQRALQAAYRILLFGMGLTGMAQMPIFKRYYIADIPGLGWLAEFYFTHAMHYLGAVLLLALLAYCAGLYLLALRRRFALTASAGVRVGLLGAIVVTGGFRVLKNLPDVTFSPGLTQFIDIAHLALMMALLAAGAAAMLGGWKWLAVRRR